MSISESAFNETGAIRAASPTYRHPTYRTTVVSSHPDSGVVGARWFGNSGFPSPGLGTVGDWYMNTDTGDIFEKTASTTWVSRGNIKGPNGGNWTTMTLEEYGALPVKDPTTLYLING